MITMIMYAKVRRMNFREKLSVNEIARRTSLSRNTIKKWLRVTEVNKLQYQRREMSTKLTPYEYQLKQALITDDYCPKRDNRTAFMLLAELKKSGYEGSRTLASPAIFVTGVQQVNRGLVSQPSCRSNFAEARPFSSIGAMNR